MQSRIPDGRRLIDLTHQIDRESAVYCGGGRYGDVYKCKYRELFGSSSVVAVKSIRCFVSSENESDAINKDLRRELGLWKRLDCDHQHIVPLLGVTKGFGPLDAIVSAWMPNGTLHLFLKQNGESLSVDGRLSILHGIASCLDYLHSIPVLHGDLTSSNILIDEQNNPRITDFGLSSALGKLQSGMSYLNRRSTDIGALRWAAPELFDDECVAKPSADVYSFGCIMLEVLSGNIPWEGKHERVVIGLKIVQRKFPDRPRILQDEHWALIVMCWSLPEERPSARQVVHYLNGLLLVDSRSHRDVVVETVGSNTDYPSTGRKRALLIAIQHVQSDRNLHDIHWAHRDIQELYRNLIDARGYHAKDIVLLMDKKHHPEELQPTRANILRQIDRLVNNASDNSHFFFYYTGHAGHGEDTDRPSEEIIAADGKVITNHTLHRHLVTPLNKVKGSKLFALFDCSYSETLLDLRLGEGPNTYSKLRSVGAGQLFRAVSISIVQLLRLSKKYSRQDVPASPQPSNFILSDSELWDAPKGKTDSEQPSVISLSACRGRQTAHDDDERQLTFTKVFFLDALAAKPDQSWVELRDELKARICEMRARCSAYLQNALVKDNVPFKLWTQEPRYSTTSHMDLTKTVEL